MDRLNLHYQPWYLLLQVGMLPYSVVLLRRIPRIIAYIVDTLVSDREQDFEL